MKLAIVIPWFGRELKGGAEQQAWQIAARLAQRGHEIDVLTTCCRSHQDDWATNHLPSGATREPEGFVVRRFPVDPRDTAAFNSVCQRLLSIPVETLCPGVSPVGFRDSEIFVNELIRSKALIEYVKAERENYDTFILLPYLYGPVIHAAMILQHRAVLQPCLHNESYAYLPQIRDMFNTVRQLLFNSEGEKELALQLMGPGIWPKSHVVGEGVEVSGAGQSAPNGAPTPAVKKPYVLYLGRKDPEKNTPLLIRAFHRFKTVRPNSELNLVLAGHGTIAVNGCDSIIDAGVVAEEEKANLLANCVALVQPSRNESFSRVIMEAWHFGRPVAAHASCLATAAAVRQSGGGWVAETEEDWAELFTVLNRISPNELTDLGQKGLQHANVLADWNHVMERYEQVLADHSAAGAGSATGAGGQIHQVLPAFACRDAIANQVLFIRDTLRTAGYASNIYARHFSEELEDECSDYKPSAISDSAAIIYHHSIGHELTQDLVEHRGPKFLIYHNITPHTFFEPYRLNFAQLLRTGRDELDELARHFPQSAGDSAFNREELVRSGFNDPSILPIAVNPARWQIDPDVKLMSALQDGRTNILFVGRIAPNKKQDDLIDAFEFYLSADPSARLILAGTSDEKDPYALLVRDLIYQKGLNKSVIVAANRDDAQLAAYYRCADLFWSMSEHEGFGVPLIEAMWFDVPVLAYKSSAVPETLGEAGLMFTTKTKLGEIAALAHLMVTDVRLREKVITAQRRRREAFLPEKVAARLLEIASTLQPVGSS